MTMNVISKEFPNATVRGVDTHNDSLEAIKEDFKDVLSNSLGSASGSIKGPKMTIELDDSINVQPIQVHTARQVPIHYQQMSNDLLDELIASKVLKPVKEPTKWISPAHFVPKPGGKNCD